MELKVGVGIGDLKFGMSKTAVEKLYGTPDGKSRDKEHTNGIIWYYDELKIRVSFFEDEGGKLGTIKISNPTVTLKAEPLMKQPFKKVKDKFTEAPLKWELDDFDLFKTYFNEQYWLTIYEEFGAIETIEMGVPFLNEEEYNWPK